MKDVGKLKGFKNVTTSGNNHFFFVVFLPFGLGIRRIEEKLWIKRRLSKVDLVHLFFLKRQRSPEDQFLGGYIVKIK